VTENLPLCAISGDAEHRGKGIRRNDRPVPTDDVSVVAVVRRLDQDELKTALNARRSGRQTEAPYLRLLSKRRAG
jgi:hypothetical protein